MQDIRKPYSHSRSNRTLSSRVEEFENNSYPEDVMSENEPVHIPVRRTRRNIDDMDMYPVRRVPAMHDKYTNESIISEEDNGRGDVIYRDPRTRYTRKKSLLGTWIFIASIGLLITGFFLFTFIFNKATITIAPKFQDVDSFQRIVTLSQNPTSTEVVSFIVATSSITKTKALLLSETKKIETKASGKIVIYNNYDAEPQKLIKNTRFESPTGKIYRINQSITVPGKVGQTPGSIEVTVYADSTGSDYNSEPVDFTIPGFKDTDRYTTFFARSKGPITGGAAGNVTMPSLSDLNAAKDELAIALASEIKENLSKVSYPGYMSLYTAIQIEYEDNEAQLTSGGGKEYMMTATGYLAMISTASLAKTIAKTSVRDFDGVPVDLSYTDTLVYAIQNDGRISKNEDLILALNGSPRIIWSTDKEQVKLSVAGKKRQEFKTLMKSVPSIDGAETSFYPLWLTRFPEQPSKITVTEILPTR